MRSTKGKISDKENLSSEALFHFTSSIDVLILILEKGFQARYIYEKIPGTKLAYMVKTACFCDIPLGSIKSHLNWYGDYGIGISRPWAKELGISPVAYIHKNTPFITKSSSLKNIELLRASDMTPYLKQVRGKQFFRNETNNTIYYKWNTFYEEREWRYFPESKDLNVVKYAKEEELNEIKDRLNNTGVLPYKALDIGKIEYIIIRDRSELQKIVSCIKRITSSIIEQEKLISKISSVSQIRRDY